MGQIQELIAAMSMKKQWMGGLAREKNCGHYG
jgi:hypothetical protein